MPQDAQCLAQAVTGIAINLRLNGRSYANLALLTPGVRESFQNGITTAGREASFNVNGLRNRANNFLLDGVDNNAIRHKQSELLQSGRAALARRSAGVQSPDQHV